MDELEITPAEVKARIDRGENVVLVDLREPWEFEICRIEGAKLVPLGALAASLNTLPDVDEVICYCHHGMRSWMRRRGCAFRASSAPSPWPEESSAGRSRSIRPSLATNSLVFSTSG